MIKSKFSEDMVLALQKARAYIFSKYKIPESDVEDILQEASLKAIKNYDKFLKKCSFNTWFISICKNEVKLYFHNNKKQDIFIEKDGSSRELVSVEPELTHRGDIEESEFLIRGVINKLSSKHKEIIELALKNAGTSKEVAAILNIPIASARTRLFYAKQHLKKLISNNQGVKFAYQSNK